jgi:hypothetical protein
MPGHHFKPVMGWDLEPEIHNRAREQRAGQGAVDPRLTALDEGALFDGSPWNTICVDRKGEVDRPGTGPPEARQG